MQCREKCSKNCRSAGFPAGSRAGNQGRSLPEAGARVCRWEGFIRHTLTNAGGRETTRIQTVRLAPAFAQFIRSQEKGQRRFSALPQQLVLQVHLEGPGPADDGVRQVFREGFLEEVHASAFRLGKNR